MKPVRATDRLLRRFHHHLPAPHRLAASLGEDPPASADADLLNAFWEVILGGGGHPDLSGTP